MEDRTHNKITTFGHVQGGDKLDVQMSACGRQSDLSCCIGNVQAFEIYGLMSPTTSGSPALFKGPDSLTCVPQFREQTDHSSADTTRGVRLLLPSVPCAGVVWTLRIRSETRLRNVSSSSSSSSTAAATALLYYTWALTSRPGEAMHCCNSCPPRCVSSLCVVDENKVRRHRDV